jgi:hypothetical protein
MMMHSEAIKHELKITNTVPLLANPARSCASQERFVMEGSRKRFRSTTTTIEKSRDKGRDGPKKDTAEPKNKKLKPTQRTYTAFSFLNTATHPVKVSNMGLDKPVEGTGQRVPASQGPHVIADVTLDKVVEKRHSAAGTQGVKDLLGTGFAPKPKVVKRMLAVDDMLAKSPDGHDFTEKHRDDYFAKYEKKYDKALGTDVSDHAAVKRRVRTLMNMQPTATYAWGLGRATHDEMAGKGESGVAALSDMEQVATNPGVDVKTLGLTTVDFGFESHFPEKLRQAAQRNIEDLGEIHKGNNPRNLKLKDFG